MTDRLAQPAPAGLSGVPRPELLAAIRSELRRHLRPEHFESWFQEVRLVSLDGNRFVFSAPSVFVRDWIRRNHLRELQRAVAGVSGNQRAEVALQLAHRLTTVLGEDHSAQSDPGASAVERDGGGFRPEGHGSGMPTAVPQFSVPGASMTPPSADRDPLRGPEDPMPEPAAAEPASPEPAIPEPAAPARPPAFRRYVQEIGERYGWGTGSTELNANYTFDQFVVGNCNRLAQAAALAAGTNPGRAYNPLFVHGNVGLGKTHLLQAICQTVLRKNEGARVLYMSCEDFTNRFIHCIQTGELDAFREYHRNIDVLVIDDVQFLANKDKTQDEFFHTFNALYNANRQIIISSDRPPSEIPTIEERLVSRFRWGLVAEMEVPGPETRVAIIKRKARLRRVEIPDDVAWFIAERIDTNIRELEGAVIKVVGVSSITERALCVDLAEEALKGVVVSRTRKLTLSDVMSVVTAHFSVSARELTGKGRTQAVSLPRQICMYLCRQNTDQSLEEIGRFFSNRDHTTVIYAVQKIKNRVKDDRVFRDLVQTLHTRLQQ